MKAINNFIVISDFLFGNLRQHFVFLDKHLLFDFRLLFFEFLHTRLRRLIYNASLYCFHDICQCTIDLSFLFTQ